MVLLGGPLGITLAPLLKSSSAGLYKALRPLANAYARAAGHRQVGLRYDDLIVEEQEDVQKAISRLPNGEAYDRVFRLKQAVQQSVLHKDLPKDQWLKPEDDVRYLTPSIEQAIKDTKEREDWDSISVERRR